MIGGSKSFKTMDITTKSLSHAVSIWGKTQKIHNTRYANLVKIALKLYVLPRMGYQTKDLSSSGFLALCDTISCLELNSVNALDAFDQTFTERVEGGSLSLETKKNYRSALGQFFNWLKVQPWYIQAAELVKIPEILQRARAKRSLSKSYNGQRLYGLSVKDLTPAIGLDLEKYITFWKQGSSSLLSSMSTLEQTPKNDSERKAWRLEQLKKEVDDGTYPLSPTFRGVGEATILQRESYILRFLGWCVNIEGYKIEDLSMRLITSQSFYEPYVDWLMQNRSCGSSVGIKLLDTAISVAKYYFFEASRTANWSDIPLIESLKQQKRAYQQNDNKEQPVKQQDKWEKKELSHDELSKVAEYLHQNLCSPQYYQVKEDGSKTLVSRKLSTIVENWQTHLMVKILTYAPVRQEELRKLRVNDTLRLMEDSRGTLRYAVRIKEHKNRLKTGKPRYYPLPSILTNDITRFIQEIRPLAINAPNAQESWFEFWNLNQASITRLEQRLQRAEDSDEPDLRYVGNTKRKLRSLKNRCDAQEIAKIQAENCDHLFFALGCDDPEIFCSPFEEVHHAVLTNKISRAIGNATLALFNEAKFLNPHGFRHIGAKHLRKIGKKHQKEKFSIFVGHGVKIDDAYADQIINEYDLIECIIDDWWHEQ